MAGRNLVIIGGGFAFTTLRALIKQILHPEHRAHFGSLLVVYGARTPGELMYRNELAEWRKRDDLDLHLTVDKADAGWNQHVGVVPAVLEELKPSPDNTILSLEMRMKCGIGKCGRCNIGGKYVCKDGPVFTRQELASLPAEY
jgi:NAD(P)H-flavin reductase